MILIHIERLSKTYGRGRLAVNALHGLNLDIKKGALWAVMGPSGCGKTTLLNILGGLDRPTTGRVILDGVDLFTLSESALYNIRRHKTGFVFQSYHLLPNLNAQENVLVPAIPRPGEARRLRARARELLALVGLSGKEKNRPGQLSGGEQQRVAVARALIMDPPVILADEPTGNLDRPNGQKIVALLQKLNRETGKTILITTHDPAVAAHCQRTITLDNGHLAGRGL
ncbi:ABC transporter ATP-binding protein [Desulfotomaculum copahuensis]|uniref:ABC transporter ATP-binding protein n=1 Tax=Desulfotomaculum copahuensis TaxID=1838280 RepID=A0A1B7LGT5_9FIRM|nr:ABC transporter ATP-binding protein [Desulfotomaculum copahuensis]OAT85313.1 ABC transporter ATP-binding protein [Desulfotomaculum copahuensis]